MNNNEERKNYTGTASATARRAYEAKVSAEAMQRAGHNPQLKGHVHEIVFRDMQNVNPENIMSGTKAVLSKSPTAVRDDVLLMKGGNVVGRFQLKDTPASIGKTVKQVSSGHYAGTNLVGTKETVGAYGQAVERLAGKGTAVTQKMTSSGISSADTSRIAAETLGKRVPAASMQRAALSSGAAGALLSGGVEVLCAGKELMDGDIDTGEFTSRVARETVSGGASAAAGMAASSAVTAAVSSALALTPAAPVALAVGLGTSLVTGGVVHEIVNEVFDDTIGETVSDFANDAADGIRYAMDDIGYAFDDAIDSFSDAVSDFGDFLGNLFSW